LDDTAPKICLLRVIIDRIIIGKRLELLNRLLLALLSITVGRAVLNFTKEFPFDCGGQKAVNIHVSHDFGPSTGFSSNPTADSFHATLPPSASYFSP
jgi:hypothetical protein